MPTIRKSPWAKLITRIEPKMMPSPTHISAYVPPTRMPALSAWRKSTEENGIRGMSAQYSSVSSGRDDRRSAPRESLVFCCRSLGVWPVATGCATPARRGEWGWWALLMLAVDNLSVSYGGLAALRGLSLNIAEGQFVAIVGPNGAGKTTLFKAISGTVRPSSGTITYEGRD